MSINFLNANSLDNQNESTYKLIEVPYINQNQVAYGCEAVSSTMLLQFYGYKINEKDFTDNYLIRKNWCIEKKGRAYGPDPNSAYCGNPYICTGANCGFGIFAPATAKSIDKILDSSKHSSKVITGMSIENIVKDYISKGVPVLIWATMNMKASSCGYSWIINYVDENSKYKIGDKFTWIRGEHCLVLVGYDENSYYFNDPYKNHGVVSYEKDLVNQRYSELGSQAIVILNKNSLKNETCSNSKEEKNKSLPSIKIGSKVKVIKGIDYYGKKFKLWHSLYDVMSINGDRIVIGVGKDVVCAINSSNLKIL